jgi:hypothetical protein
VVTVVVGLVIAGLVLALVLAVAHDPAPSPADVAFGYELAWDHLDFASLWTLSGDELRDGLELGDFVAAKRAAYGGRHGLGNLAQHIAIEEVDDRGTTAIVRTRVDLRDGGVARNEMHLTKRSGRWIVVDYRLRSDTPPVAP